MSKNTRIGFIVLILLIIGLILSVVLSRQTTKTQQNASGVSNINTSKSIPQTKNADLSMGPNSSSGNYSNKLSNGDLGSITFSITDPDTAKPTFPIKIPTVTPSVKTTGEDLAPKTAVKEGVQKVSSLIIRIKKIEVHLKSTKLNGNEDKWEALNLQTPMSFDLAQLVNGVVVNFSLTKLAVGSYDEVRLYIDDATATVDNGSIEKLDTSGKNGIVRVQQNFTVEKGRNTNLLIDFDAQKSAAFANNKFVFDPFVAKLDVNK